jgi:hypothetical protein
MYICLPLVISCGSLIVSLYCSDIAYSQFFHVETTARMAYLKNVGTLQTPDFIEVRT